MTSNDVILLDQVLASRRDQAPSGLTEAEYFEFFSFEEILKDRELSSEELLAGQVGGGLEGGVDGLFVFADGLLLEEDTDLSKARKGVELTLYVIQSKREKTFSEAPLQRLEDTLEDLLDLSKTRVQLEATGLYSEEFLERAEIFREAVRKLTKKGPQVRVIAAYASKGDVTKVVQGKGVGARAATLIEKAEQLFPAAKAEVDFYGARELYQLSLRQPSEVIELPYHQTPQSDGENGYVAFVALKEYARFLTENGSLRRYMFEGNVRDFQGWVEVNEAIASSLGDPKSPQFWWLNNGVTIVCTKATMMNERFQLTEPLIVNGLQTSMVIHDHYTQKKRKEPKPRLLLVRVIVANDAAVRDKVIRSTNSQTAVPAASLRATDPVQRDIESYFLPHGWFYDRRKNYYRNEGKPADKIISIPYLAQSMMAICLAQPDAARARPSSLIKNDADYRRVFDPELPLKLYLWAAQTQKAVDLFLRSDAAATTPEERSNLRFHLSMLAVADALGHRVFTPKQIEELTDTKIGEKQLVAALKKLQRTLADYQSTHDLAMDRVAKNRDFVNTLLDRHHPIKKKRTAA